MGAATVIAKKDAPLPALVPSDVRVNERAYAMWRLSVERNVNQANGGR